MGRQVQFYAVDADREDLIERFEALGLLAIPPSLPSEQLPKKTPPREFRPNDPAWSFYYLVPRDVLLADVHYVPMKLAQPKWRIAAERSPVIEFQPSTKRGADVHKGRLYINSDRRVPGYELVVSRYEKLARVIRQWQRTETDPIYVGPATAAQARTGALRLVRDGKELAVREPIQK